MKTPKTQNTVRVQFDMPPACAEELRRLMGVTGVATRREFYDHALALFRWAIEESQKGNVIASVDGERKVFREVVSPALQAAARPPSR